MNGSLATFGGMILVTVVVLLSQGASVWAESKTFDDAGSVATAGWIGSGNNYGFSVSNNADGVSGEGGGSVSARTDGFTFYADTTIADSLSQQVALAASGRFTLGSYANPPFDGGGDFGFFDSTSTNRVASGGGIGGIREAIMMRVLDGGAVACWRAETTLRVG